MSLESNEVDNVPRNTGQTMLYELYGRAIFGYLRLHARSLEDAEDLLLEVFLAALEHDNLSALPPRGQLAWLRRVAHNKLLNLYRQVSRHPHIALNAVVETVLETDGPEQQALRQEERAVLGRLDVVSNRRQGAIVEARREVGLDLHLRTEVWQQDGGACTFRTTQNGTVALSAGEARFE